jgi:hypothetical protein
MLATLVLLNQLRPEARERHEGVHPAHRRVQSLLIFGDRGEVDWGAGVPLALGSAVGAYVAARLIAKAWAKVWAYRFLVSVIVLSILQLLMFDSEKYLQHT